MNNSLIAKFNITAANTTIILRNINASSINWGDGTITSGELTHTYVSIGEYECSMENVPGIGSSAFRDCISLTSIIISDSVTFIGDAAFAGCTSLTSIIIPDSVTAIHQNTFQRCSALLSITIPNSVITIGGQAFLRCSALSSVILPGSITTIGYHAFSDCTSLKTIECLNSVNPPSIDSSAFPSTTTIYVPSNILEQYKTSWNTVIPDLTILPIKHITLNSLQEYHRQLKTNYLGPIDEALDDILEIQQTLINSVMPSAEGVKF